MIKFTLRDKGPIEDQVYTIDMTKSLGLDTLTGAITADTLEGTIEVHDLSYPDTKTARFFIRGGVKGEVGKALIHMNTQANQKLDALVVLGVR